MDLAEHIKCVSSLGYTLVDFSQEEKELYSDLSRFVELEPVFCGFCITYNGVTRSGKEFQKIHICRRHKHKFDCISLYYYNDNNHRVNLHSCRTSYRIYKNINYVMPEKFVSVKSSKLIK